MRRAEAAPDDPRRPAVPWNAGCFTNAVAFERSGPSVELAIRHLVIVEPDDRRVRADRLFCPRRHASLDASVCNGCDFARGASETAVRCAFPVPPDDAGPSLAQPLFLGPHARARDVALGDAYATHALAVRVDVPVARALRLLDHEGSVAVVDADGALLGLLSAATEPRGPLANFALPLTDEPALAESAPLAEAIDRMVHGRARVVPIIGKDHCFEGVVADLDVLRWVARTRSEPNSGTRRAPEVPMALEVDLLRPEAYELAPSTPVEIVETHISWVFLADREVFKVKKPVDLGFLDFRTMGQRRAACEAEVRLNTRLAPGVYRGVVAVRRGEDGRCVLHGEGPIVDWAVRMARLSDEERADTLLARGALSAGAIDSVARRVAAFHASARRDDALARYASPEAIEFNVAENFAQMCGCIEKYVDPAQAEELARWQTAFVRGRGTLFEERIASGRIVDGHGDLRLEHVYFSRPGAPTILDCVEFSDRLRFADVCADVAFLSMDLAAHGRVDLAERFLQTYARETGDFDLYALVEFYEAYRACVRAKIASIVAEDDRLDPVSRRRAEQEARRYLLLSLSADRRPIASPVLIAIGGLIASGKSTVAERASSEWCAPIVDADGTRKSMLGVEPTQALREAAWKGAYDPGFTDRVYAELLRRADRVLASGRPVVVDASFRSRAMRASARELADRHHVPFRFVECRADRATTRSRLAARELEPTVSDGRLDIFDAFRAQFEAVEELADDDHIVVDTSRPLEQTMEILRRRIDACPAALAT